MRREPLSSSGPSTPPICLGTYTLAGAWGGSLDTAKEALRHGIRSGLGFLDTAHAYGRAESVIGEVLAPELTSAREEIVLCSKGGLDIRAGDGAASPFAPNSNPRFLRECLIESLRRLGVEYLDLYLVHWFDPDVPIVEVAGAMRGFVDEGLVRRIGVSNYSVEQIEAFLTEAPVDVIQVPYSLFSRSVEKELLPFADKHGIGVMGYASLAQGYLTGSFTDPPSFVEGDFRRSSPDFSGSRYSARVQAAQQMAEVAAEKGCALPDLAVAWAAAGPIRVIPLVGIQAPEHVDSLLRAIDLELSGNELSELRTIAETAPEMEFDALVT